MSIFLCNHGEDARPVSDGRGGLKCQLCDGAIPPKNQENAGAESVILTRKELAAARRELATARRESNRRFDQLSERLDALENRHAG